ncbi:hypothetical protein BB558_006469 [Smittium angustum]|uniref:Uncharacterized protein n=1 Tax=Smittium angustum TaxID=133377 RepID=A0A2U1IXQ6_SMIAN|nr:hypothetical protein BB558_006469 [Smittium angustum]
MIIDFYDLPQEDKENLESTPQKMIRGSAELEYGKPAHVLNAAQISRQSRQDITTETIFNCFLKARIIPQFDEVISKDVIKPSNKNKSTDDVRINNVSELIHNFFSEYNIENMVGNIQLESFLKMDEKQSIEYCNTLIEEIDQIIFKNQRALDIENDISSILEAGKAVETQQSGSILDLSKKLSNMKEKIDFIQTNILELNSQYELKEGKRLFDQRVLSNIKSFRNPILKLTQSTVI